MPPRKQIPALPSKFLPRQWAATPRLPGRLAPLRYASASPPPHHQSGLAGNVTKPHAERQARSGRPLRDDSELVANTIRFRCPSCIGNPSGAPLSDNGK